MASSSVANRNGITLMEVLISIGILAIGLSSVVALVPAGKSEAAKAVIMDRSANLAMNVLNDAIVFGLVRPACIVANPPLSSTSPTVVVFDPLHEVSGTSVWSNTASGTVAIRGILSPATPPPTANRRLMEPLLQGRDDIVYAAPGNEDVPPTNLFSSGTLGTRQFQGRTTALFSLAAFGTVGSGTIEPGTLAKATAVVFHNRSLDSVGDAIVTGAYNELDRPAGTIALDASSLPSDRSLKEAIRSGTVVYSSLAAPAARWHQVAMASVDEGAGIAYVTFVGDAEPPPGPVQIALDSVGLAERVVALEGPGPYGQ